MPFCKIGLFCVGCIIGFGHPFLLKFTGKIFDKILKDTAAKPLPTGRSPCLC